MGTRSVPREEPTMPTWTTDWTVEPPRDSKIRLPF